MPKNMLKTVLIIGWNAAEDFIHFISQHENF